MGKSLPAYYVCKVDVYTKSPGKMIDKALHRNCLYKILETFEQ